MMCLAFEVLLIDSKAGDDCGTCFSYDATCLSRVIVQGSLRLPLLELQSPLLSYK